MKVNNPSPALTRKIAKRLTHKIANIISRKSKTIKKTPKSNQ